MPAEVTDTALDVRKAYDALGKALEAHEEAVRLSYFAKPAPPSNPVIDWPIAEEGVAMVKYFEGLYLQAYRDPVGIWTIGYGHTGKTHADGTVHEGRTITAGEADRLLAADLSYFANAVRNLVKVQLDPNQFAALVSFAFNLGEGNLKRSTLLERLNAGRYYDVPNQLRRWVYAGKTVLLGLKRRREAEALMWQGKDWKPATTMT